MNTSTPSLQALKALQHQRGDVSPFKTHTEFLVWVDKVTPLLEFDRKLQSAFTSSAGLVDLRTSMPGLEYDVASVNKCIGLLNQATLSCEMMDIASQNAATVSNSRSVQLTWPATFTLKWWFEHAPLSAYASLFSALVVAFGAGAWFNDFRTTIQSKPLSATPPTTDKPINASTDLRQSNSSAEVIESSSSSSAK